MGGMGSVVPNVDQETGRRRGMDDFFNIAFHEAVTPGGRSQSSTRSPPSRLEDLPDSDRKPSGISLRGANHAKIPDIANQPLNTLLPITRDEVAHSQPYYITQSTVLQLGPDRPPWQEASQKFQTKFLAEFLKDCLSQEVQTICSSYLAGAKAGVKKDRAILAWLQEEVIEPVVWEQAELSLYEELWDAARTLTESEGKPLTKIYKDKEVQGTFIHFLKDHHRKPLTLDEGKSIYSHQWGEILFHLNKIVSRASLMENYAIRRLQEQFITQVAAQVLFEEGVKYMEQEMDEIDQQERIENPPRELRL